jgi:hypothetical protein
MTADDHASSVDRLLTEEPPRSDDGPAATGRLRRLCRCAARDLSSSGVGVSVATGDGSMVTAAVSGDATLSVERLQFTLGEGPCIDAHESGRPVLVPALAAATQWQAYASAAHEQGVRAVFAFPLQVGAARVGALDVYRAEEGSLSIWALSRAGTYAAAAMHAILDVEPDLDELADFASNVAETRFEVYQAQGMLTVQLRVTADEALLRLRAYAYARDRPIDAVAADVIARRVRLDKDNW